MIFVKLSLSFFDGFIVTCLSLGFMSLKLPKCLDLRQKTMQILPLDVEKKS